MHAPSQVVRDPLRSQHGSSIDATHLAYFFIPLPEPMGLPDGYVTECTTPATLDWRLRRSREFGESPSHLLDASLCFRHTTSSAGGGRELLELFRSAADFAQIKPHRWWRWPRRRASQVPAIGAERTIVEMAVPITISERDLENHEDGEDLVYQDVLTEAFDRGVGYLRDVQRSYYLATRRPLHLTARLTLPFAVPMMIRALAGHSELARPDGISMFFVNQNLGRDVREPLESPDLERLTIAMDEQATGGIVARYLEFVREGGVAADLDGDTRAATVFFATASEVLLDESLSHLLWESGMRPEDAASLFDTHRWLTGRVKSLYHPRVGGCWDTRVPGPVASWFASVAGLRNRVVHAGYEPSFSECDAARASLSDLQDFIADRVCDHLATYPRTAMALVGRRGLEDRGLWTRSVEALVSSTDEVPWKPTFARWRTAMHRCRQESATYVEPHAEEAVVVAVLRSRGQADWVAHDPKAGLASKIDKRDIITTKEQLSGVEAHLEELRGDPRAYAISIALSKAVLPSTAALTWVPEYRLLPLTGVMVNGQDLDPLPGQG